MQFIDYGKQIWIKKGLEAWYSCLMSMYSLSFKVKSETGFEFNRNETLQIILIKMLQKAFCSPWIFTQWWTEIYDWPKISYGQ